MSTHPETSHQLRRVLIAYLALALLDLIHHLHAKFALGDEGALYPALIGIVLTPMTLTMYFMYVKNKKKVFAVICLSIVSLAVLVPGIYHGGFKHLAEFINLIGSSHGANTFRELLPNNQPHQWFYQITGTLEFFLALFCIYFIYRYIKSVNSAEQLQ